MESFESFIALAMEAEGLVVSGPHKFPIGAMTSKTSHAEYQVHGREIDLIGASEGRLVLATVKSFLGSQGVKANEVMGTAGKVKGYAMLNDPRFREKLIQAAADRYGYKTSQVEVRLYAGRFQNEKGEAAIREWAARQRVGGGPIGVFGPLDYVDVVKALAESTTYIDHPIIAAIKVMNHADKLRAKAAEKMKELPTVATVTRQFPLGSHVRSSNDGFAGIVVGYTDLDKKTAYVRILDEETGATKLRSANTLNTGN